MCAVVVIVIDPMTTNDDDDDGLDDVNEMMHSMGSDY